MKKLIPAAGMLMVSAMMLGTSTFAWFTMNKEVTVTGMEVRTKVGSNLLITEDNYVLTHDGDNRDNLYKTDIKMLRQCLLEPASTVDGKVFYYTVEANAAGQKLSGASWNTYEENASTAVANETAGKTNYSPAFNVAYGQTGNGSGTFTASNIALSKTSGSVRDGAAYGYVDYVFYIKATTEKAGQHVVMTKCNLQKAGNVITTSGSIPDVDRAWRVAVLKQDASMNTDVTADVNTDGTLVTVLKPANAVNHVADNAVDGADSRTSITNHDAKADLGEIANSGATAYYRVTVRLWLEGEDTTCTSETYAKLTNDYSLDLEFKLEDSDGNAVTSIGSEAGWYGKASAT